MDPYVLRKKVREIVEPPIHRLGFDLVAVEWGTDRGRPVLRLSIDGPKGVGADDCAEVTFRVSPLLDEADPIDGSYALEVSSPGIERPVERLDDWRRLMGFRAKIRLFEGHPRRRYTGTITGVDGGQVVVNVDGAEHRIDFDSIERAHLVLDLDEFERLPGLLYPAGLGESAQ
jgi:ribosome maturation factor RimP